MTRVCAAFYHLPERKSILKKTVKTFQFFTHPLLQGLHVSIVVWQEIRKPVEAGYAGDQK